MEGMDALLIRIRTFFHTNLPLNLENYFKYAKVGEEKRSVFVSINLLIPI